MKKYTSVEVNLHGQFTMVVACWTLKPVTGEVVIESIKNGRGDVTLQLDIQQRMKVLDAVADTAKNLTIDERKNIFIDQFETVKREAV